MADLPNTQIQLLGAQADLTGIQVVDLVGPPAANRQPDELRAIVTNLRQKIDTLVENMNAITGVDASGTSVTPDGEDTYLERSGDDPMLGALDMGSNKITNLSDGTANSDAATVGQLPSQANLDPLLPRDGTRPMLADLPAGNNKIVDVSPGSAGTDAVNFNQLQDQVPRDGSRALTAPMDAGSNRLTNLAIGTANSDAATVGQLPDTPTQDNFQLIRLRGDAPLPAIASNIDGPGDDYQTTQPFNIRTGLTDGTWLIIMSCVSKDVVDPTQGLKSVVRVNGVQAEYRAEDIGTGSGNDFLSVHLLVTVSGGTLTLQTLIYCRRIESVIGIRVG